MLVASHSRLELLAAAVLSVASAACAGDPGDRALRADGGGLLGAPVATFPEDFGSIQTVRELPDGRVLVADPLGNALYVVDMEAGSRMVLGAEGQGPGEYSQPDAVWPLPGDSTLLIDLGNGRMSAIGADLSFGPTSPLSTGDPRSGMVVAIPQGVDGRGNVYARSMGGMGSLPDSGAILRVDRGSMAVDTVASFKLEDRRRTTSGSAGNQNVQISAIPLSLQDAWGVAADGSVVVARSGDYRVEWFSPDGSVVEGPPIPYESVSIGTAEKEEWVVDSRRAGGGIGISVMVDNGRMQMSFSRGAGGSDRPEIEQYDWPLEKPPFYSDRIQVDPFGRAWIRRHVEAGEDATYDLFDSTGSRVETVEIPADRRLVGFGAEAVYVVAFDELDLSYLERYVLPPM